MKETWADALLRLERWTDDVAVSWAEARNSIGQWSVLGASVRGGVRVGDIEYEYERLRVRSRMQPPRDTALNLRAGRILRSMGDREFRDVQPNEGQVLWLTSGTVYTMSAPLEMPSYYASVNIGDMNLVNEAQLTQPVFGSNAPYYPTGEDALLDVLFGVTRDQGRRDLYNQILIHLPYTAAHIQNAVYIDREGVAINVGGESVTGHRLEALWKVQAAERTYQRTSKVLDEAGRVVIPLNAEPHVFHAALQDPSGLLVDTADRHRQYTAEEVGLRLAPEALPEALDFVASVWKNLTKTRLLELRQITAASQLGMNAATREEFVSRMSALADVFKGIHVDESLYEPAAAKGLDSEATLARIRLVTDRLLTSADATSAFAAISTLQDVVQIRTALQHEKKTKADLPTSLAKLAIPYPGPWADIWELVRRRTVGALRDLRQALESATV